MAIIKCKMCGGDLEFTPGATVGECEYCGTRQTLPKAGDEMVQNLFNRANNLRLKCEFDKAERIYEKILQENDTEAEAHWGIVLCKYGIEYVEDPKTLNRIPTCHRTSYDAVITDGDYLAALEHADAMQRSIYEAEARRIDEIQKDILSIVKNEKPFDVFICYKETDEDGKRTPDSAIANDIYYQLTQEGLKVFYAAITLEDKLGQAYEPYIFAALSSAKVMLVIGTKPHYFTAVWVKNEWSRFLKLMKSDRSKLLIPCYKGMDAYELPEEFAHLQAQDMTKIGFINDVVRGIRKVVGKDTTAAVLPPVMAEAVPAAPATAALLDRAFLFAEDGNWVVANDYCEKVLDADPRNAQAYLGKLLIDLKVPKPEELSHQDQPFDDNSNFQKALRFGDEALQATLNGYIQQIKDRNTEKALAAAFAAAVALMEQGKFEEAIPAFEALNGYGDSTEMAARCRTAIADGQYDAAMAVFTGAGNENEWLKAAALFEAMDGYRDSAQKAAQSRENAETARKNLILANAKAKMTGSKIKNSYEAIALLATIAGWKNADALKEECGQKIVALKEAAEAARLEVERQTEIRRQEAEERAQRAKKAVAIVLPVTCLLMALVLLINCVIIPMIGYNKAVKLMDAGQYSDAISAFQKLDGWKDSQQKINDCSDLIAKDNQYNDAVALMNSGELNGALALFLNLGDYRDSAQLAANCQTLIDMAVKYETACAYMEEGKYAAAITLFTELGDYKDSAEKLALCQQEMATEQAYNEAVALMEAGKYAEALAKFQSISGYKDSDTKANECSAQISAEDQYQKAVTLMNQGKYEQAITAFKVINGYKDSASKITQCQTVITDRDYQAAVALEQQGKTAEAAMAFGKLGDYRDARVRSFALWDTIAHRETVSAGSWHTVGLKADGTVVAVGLDEDGQRNVTGWRDIVAISAGQFHTVGLKADGTVVAVGLNDYGQCNVTDWTDIVAISAGNSHTVGLKANGTVVAVGYNGSGQCNVTGWRDIVAISAGSSHTVGLKADGTVVAVGSNSYGRCDVTGWRDIVAISTGLYHTVGLKADGTVVAVGYNSSGRLNVTDWRDIVAISARGSYTVGLNANGTVVAVGDNFYDQCNVTGWTDIVAVSAGKQHTVGLKADGTVVAVGSNSAGRCNVTGWTNIKLP